MTQMIGNCSSTRLLKVCVTGQDFCGHLICDGLLSPGLKAALLHRQNELPSVPIAYSEEMRETRENIANLLRKVNYNKNMWMICSDVKMIGILCGLMKGWPKYPCHICLFDSRFKKPYEKLEWPRRMEYVVGEKSIEAEPLVPGDRIIIPPLHVKLGLMRIFIVAVLKIQPELMTVLKHIFSDKTDLKISCGVFFLSNLL